jgi:hypothetical protein
MTNSIWEMIAGTPWWVFALFAYLVKIGYSATKPSIVEFKKLWMLPTALIILSVIGIDTIAHGAPKNLLAATGAALLGIPLGWLHYKSLKIKAVQDKKQLYIPGTWSVLVIILAIFAVKYYCNYQLEVNPEIFLRPQNALTILTVYGLFIGLFIGRMAYSFCCIKYGPYVKDTLQIR